jgi:DNA-binding XRE family transcriptional regulator
MHPIVRYRTARELTRAALAERIGVNVNTGVGR